MLEFHNRFSRFVADATVCYVIQFRGSSLKVERTTLYLKSSGRSIFSSIGLINGNKSNDSHESGLAILNVKF